MRRSLIAVVAVAIIGGGFFILTHYLYSAKQHSAAEDHKSAEYVIAGERVMLSEGYAEHHPPSSGASEKTVTQYFGNDLIVDVNDDGRDDVVFLLTQETGGSGVFYYVVAALNTEGGHVGGAGYLLGDRIAPQTIDVSQNPSHKNVLIVHYADRAPEEPMTTPPSVGKSVYLKYDPVAMQFGVVETNFEGEADPSLLTLEMNEWKWVRTEHANGSTTAPRTPGVFGLTFGADGRVSVATDCNTMGGAFEAENGTITFSAISSTKKLCQGSEEAVFASYLPNVEGYHFTSRGELVLKLASGDAVVLR